jgi:rhodanese-related sulfurtransferase
VTATLIDRDQLRSLFDTESMQLMKALPAAFAAEHLLGELTPELTTELVPNLSRTVVVYGSKPFCNRSNIAATAFSRLGYTDVRVYAGGKQDWCEAGLALAGIRADKAV